MSELEHKLLTQGSLSPKDKELMTKTGHAHGPNEEDPGPMFSDEEKAGFLRLKKSYPSNELLSSDERRRLGFIRWLYQARLLPTGMDSPMPIILPRGQEVSLANQANGL